MAVIGQALTAPESGWKRITTMEIDKVCTKEGTANYNTGVTTVYSEGDYISIINPNSKVKFNFNGSKIRIISRIFNSYSNNVSIKINGIETIVNTNNTNTVNMALIYENINTGQNKNYVEITNNTSSNFILDNIDISVEGNVSEYTQNLISNKILLLQSNGDTLTLEKGEYTENIIPTMTTNTTPSGEAKVSSSSSNAYKYFDKVRNSSSLILGVNGWVQYKFETPQKINKYKLVVVSQNYSPRAWKFQGSNDENEWVDLDLRDGVTDWGIYTDKDFTFENNNEYSYYRITPTELNNGTQFHISEIEMMGQLKPKISKLPSYSEQNLIKYGMDSPIQVDEILTDKNYILSTTESINTSGLLQTQINRKPLSINFS